MREAAVGKRLKAKQEGKFCRKSSFLGRRIDERAPAAGCPGARRGGKSAEGGQKEKLPPGNGATENSCSSRSISSSISAAFAREDACQGREGGSIQHMPRSPFQCFPRAVFRGNVQMLASARRGVVAGGDGKWQCLVELTGPKKPLTKHVILLKCKCLAKPVTYFLPSNSPNMSGMKSFLSVQGQEFEGFCKSKPSFGWKKKIIQVE